MVEPIVQSTFGPRVGHEILPLPTTPRRTRKPLDHRLPVLLGEHARAVGPGEQDVVPFRQEADGRRGLGVRQRRSWDVEELAALLVAEAAQRVEQPSAASISATRIMLQAPMSRRVEGPKDADGEPGGQREHTRHVGDVRCRSRNELLRQRARCDAHERAPGRHDHRLR